jgi:hypothetical protein
MSRQVPHVEDIATGTPAVGLVPVSAGAGLAPAWGAVSGGGASTTRFSYYKEASISGASGFGNNVLPQTHRNILVVAKFRQTEDIADLTAFVDTAVSGSRSGEPIYDAVRLDVDAATSLVSVANDQESGQWRLGAITSNQSAGGSPSPIYETGGDARMSALWFRIAGYTDTDRFKSVDWKLMTPTGPASTGGQLIKMYVGSGQVETLEAITGIIFSLNSLAQNSWCAVYGEDLLP